MNPTLANTGGVATYPTLPIWDAAELIAPANNDKAPLRFADMLVDAAEAGELPAAAVAEPGAMAPLWVMGGGRSARTEKPAPKTINHSSPVCLFKVCEWFTANGYPIPDKALDLLPRDARDALASAKTVRTAQAAQEVKYLQLFGHTLLALAPYLPPALRHADGVNVNAKALLAKVAERLQDAEGNVPHGWGKSTLAEMVKRAESAAAEFLKSIAPDGFGAIQLEPATGKAGDNGTL